MNSEPNTQTALDEAFVGQRLLLKLGGRTFLVEALACDDDAIHVSFPGGDYPLDGLMVDLEHHDDEGVTVYRARVIHGARDRGEGLVLERPTEGHRRLHREAFRVPTDLAAQVRDQRHPRRYNADVVNLSSGGALLQADAPFVEDSLLSVSLSIPREVPCTLMGHVVHLHWRHTTPLAHKALLGLQFTDLEPEIRQTLSTYVGHRLRHLASVD